jgi:hypothetical protein
MLGNNWEAAKRENGEVAKYFRATSGISITDIEKYGIRGGPGSEMSKILGGEDSVASQVVKALDPTQWKVELPKLPDLKLPDLKLPDLKVDPPTITVGGTRVCVPWC